MYVMGGETRKTGPNAGIGLSALRTYYRVDVYDVEQNKWTRVRLLRSTGARAGVVWSGPGSVVVPARQALLSPAGCIPRGPAPSPPLPAPHSMPPAYA